MIDGISDSLDVLALISTVQSSCVVYESPPERATRGHKCGENTSIKDLKLRIQT